MARRQKPRNPLKFSRKSRRRPHLLHRRRKYKNILGRYYKRKTKRHGRRVNRKRLPSGAAFARVIARKVKNRLRRMRQQRHIEKGDRVVLNSGAGATVVATTKDNVIVEIDGYVGNKSISRQAIRSKR
jgi:preprotein translocase subunit YajC